PISSVEDAVQGQERRIPMTKLKTTRRRGRTTRFAALLSATALVGSAIAAYAPPPVDLSKWSPEYVRSIAGTQEFDTAAECGKVTPLDYKGTLTFWYQGVFQGHPGVLAPRYTDL